MGKSKNCNVDCMFSLESFFVPWYITALSLFFSRDTCAIHHFSGSWHSRKDKLKARLIRILGVKNIKFIRKIIGRGKNELEI